MYTDIPFWLSLVFMFGGLAALAWSSDLFVDGAAQLAKALGISPFVIGMVVIGFGTSAPELIVSALAGVSGHSDLSLGNAYGSSAFNIAVILGVSAMILPLVVRPAVSFVAGPMLAAISVFSIFALRDGVCSRIDAAILIVAFAVLMPLYCWFDQKARPVDPGANVHGDAKSAGRRLVLIAALKAVVGLAALVASSHVLVWGAVDFARQMGVSDLVIGLTIVACGTSLPELASAVASARRGEHEFVLGNIMGSNLFNMLAVVGIATVISPSEGFSGYIVVRDLPFLLALSLSITLFGMNWRSPGSPGTITRGKAATWLLAFTAYAAVMLWQELR